MIGLEFLCDPAVWQPVPTSFPDETGLSADGWIADQSARARARGMAESPTAGPVENYFHAVAGFAHDHAGVHDEFWILVAPDALGVIALLLDVVEATGSLNDRLAGWAERSGTQYEPANVEQFVASGLGEGYVVVRNDIDPEDRSVYATLIAVFRVRGYDVIVSTQTYDTAALDWAMPRIRDFVDGIVVLDGVRP